MLPLEEQAKFDAAFQLLLVKGIQQQIPTLLGSPLPLNSIESQYFVSIASILSLSDSSSDRTIAYEVITRVLELSSEPTPTLISAVELILARLGNFPARKYTQNRFEKTIDLSGIQSVHLALEEISRSVENTIEIREKEVTLTDFQRRLFDALERWNSISVSAPTSAGKSFLLSLDVVRHYIRKTAGSIVFVVPTRALIRQVMRDVIEQLRNFDIPEVPVICVPEIPPDNFLKTGIVYVLTQERLTNLISTHGKNVPISLLIVDEAQEMGDTGRGIVLQSAIERTIAYHPKARILFASPLRSNPGFLLTLFGRTEQGEFFVERTSPVSQNIILISQVKGKPQQAALKLLREESFVELNSVDLPFRFRIEKGQRQPQLLANFSIALTQNNDSTIVYVNEPTQAESTALALTELLPETPNLPQRVTDLIDFLQNNVHVSYPLINCLRRGVAFHYGAMPEIIRVEVEDLLRESLLQYVCCTSTLLQGVNLPAKNVVVFRPTRGRGSPLDKGGFWNLAGRAGRLMQEYSGNVWCISPEKWEMNPLEGERLVEMKSAFQSELQNHANEVLAAATDSNRASESGETLLADQTYAKVFSDFTLQDKQLAMSSFCSEINRSVCEQLDLVCNETRNATTIPDSLFRQHNSVLPQRIEELAAHFRSSDLDTLIPLHPLQSNSYRRLESIFETLEKVFFKTETRSYVYFTHLSHKWMTSESLTTLIADAIKHGRVPNNDSKRISRTIRDLLNNIQTDLRYKYVKYLRLYNEILDSYLKSMGRDDLLKSMSPIHLFIEYGACSESLIQLMSLGLSRTTAISFSKAIGLPRIANWEQCSHAVEKTDLRTLNLPMLVVREINSLRHRTS